MTNDEKIERIMQLMNGKDLTGKRLSPEEIYQEMYTCDLKEIAETISELTVFFADLK